jgi:hypothetical protein
MLTLLPQLRRVHTTDTKTAVATELYDTLQHYASLTLAIVMESRSHNPGSVGCNVSCCPSLRSVEYCLVATDCPQLQRLLLPIPQISPVSHRCNTIRSESIPVFTSQILLSDSLYHISSLTSSSVLSHGIGLALLLPEYSITRSLPLCPRPLATRYPPAEDTCHRLLFFLSW